MKGRYAALALMLLCMLLPAYGRADVREQIEAHRDTSVLVEVPGRGRMKLYPQTNPRYAYMKFEYKEIYKYPTYAMLNLTDNCNLACIYCFVQ